MSKRVNIIGGGIAGCALAFMIKREGGEPVLYESASSLYDELPEHDCSTYNPRYCALWDANAQYFSLGYFEALRLFDEFAKEGVDFHWDQCGTLQLLTDERKAKRYRQTVKNWGANGWAEEDLRLVSAKEASELAGLPVAHEGMYLGRAGVISPARVCTRLIKDVEVKLNQWVEDIALLPGDATILACGAGVTRFEQGRHLPIQPVRGQVTYIRESEASAKVKTTVNYGGHISPSRNGVQYIGATFQPWLRDTKPLPEDDEKNIQNLCERFPAAAARYEVVDSKAGVRAAARDHFPVIGQVADRIYVSSGHGSHGFVSSLSAALILANKILKNKDVVSNEVMQVMSSERF